MKKVNIFILSFLSFVLVSSFTITETLKGTWQFVGGIYNGKKEGAPAGYVLQREYDVAHYEAFAIEKGYQPEKYETGNYSLKGTLPTGMIVEEHWKRIK